jgi:hypothetical protein
METNSEKQQIDPIDELLAVIDTGNVDAICDYLDKYDSQ